ncbi:MAG: hypothetical protein L0323_10765 [Planctomycetes bacterium]|nr:hypothetical protein [Planctomycetota bacterium]
MKPLRVYADTSVFGGVADPEFAAPSRKLFGHVRQGRVVLLVSLVVVEELRGAPPAIRQVLESLGAGAVAPVDLTPEVIELRDAYLAAGIVPRRYPDDATHVAAATVARADAIVSWSFKHIVRVDKMKAYNRVNFELGFGVLSIVTPQEFRFEEED